MFTMLQRHAAGDVTYSATIDQDGLARLGAIDIDEGGRDALLVVLLAAYDLGLHAFAVAVDGKGGHNGGHVWFLYDQLYPSNDICAQLRQVANVAGISTIEIWPRNQGIRLPFGYHQSRGTRGDLLYLLDGIDLITIMLDINLSEGFDLVQCLPLDTAPPVAEPKPAPELRPIRKVSRANLALNVPALPMYERISTQT